MENVLVELNLAREDAAYARSLLDRFGFRYSVVESGDRRPLLLRPDEGGTRAPEAAGFRGRGSGRVGIYLGGTAPLGPAQTSI